MSLLTDFGLGHMMFWPMKSLTAVIEAWALHMPAWLGLPSCVPVTAVRTAYPG